MINIFTLKLICDNYIKESSAQLRGFFATKFNEYDLLHQHNTDELIYRYPLVQYKVIDGKAMVIGINEGACLLKSLYSTVDQLNLNNNEYRIIEKQIRSEDPNFGISDQLIKYDFLSPWFALNQVNYRKYCEYGHTAQIELLHKNLIGNIISMSKAFKYHVPEQIKCHIEVTPTKAVLKNNEVIGFKGFFITNFEIPEYLGIGKSVSRGFGTVRRCSL